MRMDLQKQILEYSELDYRVRTGPGLDCRTGTMELLYIPIIQVCLHIL